MNFTSVSYQISVVIDSYGSFDDIVSRTFKTRELLCQ
jgi:hypothetical protein